MKGMPHSLVDEARPGALRGESSGSKPPLSAVTCSSRWPEMDTSSEWARASQSCSMRGGAGIGQFQLRADADTQVAARVVGHGSKMKTEDKHRNLTAQGRRGFHVAKDEDPTRDSGPRLSAYMCVCVYTLCMNDVGSRRRWPWRFEGRPHRWCALVPDHMVGIPCIAYTGSLGNPTSHCTQGYRGAEDSLLRGSQMHRTAQPNVERALAGQ